jgi:hypothetical protein
MIFAVLMRGRFFVTALVLTAAPAGAQENDVWRACSIDSVQMCMPAGCAARRPAISVYIGYHRQAGIERAVYLRCAVGLSSCDRYDPVVRHVGDVLVFSLPEHSLFSRLGKDDRLTDVAGVQDAIFVSRGRCIQAAPPPISRWRSWRD